MPRKLKDGSYGFTRAEVEGKYKKNKKPICEQCHHSNPLRPVDLERRPREDIKCTYCDYIIPGRETKKLFNELKSIEIDMEEPVEKLPITIITDPCHVAKQIECLCDILSQQTIHKETMKTKWADCMAKIEKLPTPIYEYHRGLYEPL